MQTGSPLHRVLLTLHHLSRLCTHYLKRLHHQQLTQFQQARQKWRRSFLLLEQQAHQEMLELQATT
jgi:hypothetical protein